MVKVIVASVILFISIVISKYFGRDCSERTGSNIADKHFKEKWGMDDKTEYHD